MCPICPLPPLIQTTPWPPPLAETAVSLLPTAENLHTTLWRWHYAHFSGPPNLATNPHAASIAADLRRLADLLHALHVGADAILEPELRAIADARLRASTQGEEAACLLREREARELDAGLRGILMEIRGCVEGYVREAMGVGGGLGEVLRMKRKFERGGPFLRMELEGWEAARRAWAAMPGQVVVGERIRRWVEGREAVMGWEDGFVNGYAD